MSTLTYCAKQETAMAEFATERAKSKMDSAIDAEQTRDELIAARAQEIETQRLLEMKPIDVVAGMQSILENGAAPLIGRLILAKDRDAVGTIVEGLIRGYIRDDSETMAHDWMERMDKEIAMWGAQ